MGTCAPRSSEPLIPSPEHSRQRAHPVGGAEMGGSPSVGSMEPWLGLGEAGRSSWLGEGGASASSEQWRASEGSEQDRGMAILWPCKDVSR